MVVPASPKPASDYAKEWWNQYDSYMKYQDMGSCVICGQSVIDKTRDITKFNTVVRARTTHVIHRLPTDCEYGKKGEFVWAHFWNCWNPYERSLKKSMVVEYVVRIPVDNVLDEEQAIGHGHSSLLLSRGEIVESRVVAIKENNNK